MTIFPAPKPKPSLPKRKAAGSSLAAPDVWGVGRNEARKAAEFVRCYGSEERVEWIKSFGCVICGKKPSENVHVRGGGAGRKADARFVVPGCRAHHNELHRNGVETFEADHSIDLEATADRFEAQWQAHLEGKAS
jgi:hypothetical protein